MFGDFREKVSKKIPQPSKSLFTVWDRQKRLTNKWQKYVLTHLDTCDSNHEQMVVGFNKRTWLKKDMPGSFMMGNRWKSLCHVWPVHHQQLKLQNWNACKILVLSKKNWTTWLYIIAASTNPEANKNSQPSILRLGHPLFVVGQASLQWFEGYNVASQRLGK